MLAVIWSIEDQKFHQTYKYEIDKRFHFIVAIVDTLSPSTAWNRSIYSKHDNATEKRKILKEASIFCKLCKRNKKTEPSENLSKCWILRWNLSNRNKDEKLFEQKVTHEIYWIEWNEAPNEKRLKLHAKSSSHTHCLFLRF